MIIKFTKMQHVLTVICFAVLTFGMDVNSKAANYYISPSGSDSNTGSISSPWKTISYASAKLKPGDVLYARGGTYLGQFGRNWKTSGTSGNPVTLKAYLGETPIFDGEWGAGPDCCDGEFMTITNLSWVVIDGITIQHYDDPYGDGAIGINNSGGPVSNITVQNCKFYDNGTQPPTDHHIYIGAGATNLIIRNNLFVRTPGGAIHIYHTPYASGIKIYNNVIIGGTSTHYPGNQTWGIIIGDGRDVEIFNNTIYNVLRGIDFNYGASGSPGGTYVVRNNLMVNCTSVGLSVTASPANYQPYFSSSHNGFWGNASDVIWGTTKYTLSQFQAATVNEDFSFKADPLFVAMGSDFHLKTGSPAIDKGTATGAPSNDFDYVVRAGNDIGAYEYRLSTGIENSSTNENSFTLYPNPFQTYFNIKISSEIIIKDALMKIYDVCGKEVKVVSINDYETTIDRAELKSGIYFYNVINNNENIFKGKLVVQ